MPKSSTLKRYSPLWVTIHWLVAILIFAAFYFGISSFQSPTEAKAAYLRFHMPIGITVLALMLVRLYLRWRTPRPEDATAGNAFFDMVARGVHHALYLFAFFMPLSGLALSARYGLPPIVFEGQGSMPADLNPALHGLFFFLFALLILLHIGAALYHQFIRKDNLLARMWYGK